MRGHHPQLEAGARLLRLVAHRLEAAAGGLGCVGLDQGRVEPGQVPPHRVELRGEEDGHRPVQTPLPLLLVEDLAHADLVLGVSVGEQQADADAAYLRIQQRRRGLAHILLAKRRHLGAEHVDPPPHAPHPFPRDKRRVVVMGRQVEAVRVGVAEVGLDAPLDSQVVLLSRSDDRPDLESLSGEQSVEHRGPAVDARGDPAEGPLRRRLPLLERVAGRLHEADRLVLRRRLRLADHERARLVDDEGVGHRPAGIDRQHSGTALRRLRHGASLSRDHHFAQGST